jgi:GDPmannose 4,6-dehydratase
MNLPLDNDDLRKRVLILGAGGQDGPFLSQLASTKFKVIAHTRKSSQRLQDLKVETIACELSSPDTLKELISRATPDIVVNLVSLSSVFECQKNPEISHAINFKFVIELVESLQRYAIHEEKKVRLIQASSSEIFGSSEGPCSETTDLAPISQYGIDKALAHEYLQNYSSDEIEIKRAILFNHESEYRNEKFVSQKIAVEAAKFRLGMEHQLTLGNVNSARDWGYAPDYMEALSLILDSEGRETFVVASGELHKIEEIIRIAFGVAPNFEITSLYTTDPRLIRKDETKPLIGSSKALLKAYGWIPKVSFPEMIEKMVQFQLNKIDSSI